MSALQPKVSVVIVTYNHERYIAQTLGSVLSQQTSFPIEIIVGEDASTDRTREIILEFQARHPDQFRLFLHPRNVGMMENYVQVLSACRGQYVALLEGDDYWTDDTKLQQQADFLDAHPDCAICHHNAWRILEGSDAPPLPWHIKPFPRWQSLTDLLRQNVIVTATCMYRNGLFPRLPEWFTQAATFDWPLHVLNARHGRIAYLDKIMAAYRLHPQSVWSSTSRFRQLQGMLTNAGLVRPLLTPRQQRQLDRVNRLRHEECVELLLRDGHGSDALAYARQHLSDLCGYHRLKDFFDGLQQEEQGHRLRANQLYFKALSRGWGRTRVRAPDILLALTRLNCPRAYRLLRRCYRRYVNREPGS